MPGSFIVWPKRAGLLILAFFSLLFLSGCVWILNESTSNDPFTFVYDRSQDLHFVWGAYPFPDDVNGSYRISLVHETYSGISEYKVAHHWADNPNGTQFMMGLSDEVENIQNCDKSSSYIIVQPETYELELDPISGVYEYHYTPVLQPDWMAEQCECRPPDEDESDTYYLSGMLCSCPANYPLWFQLPEEQDEEPNEAIYMVQDSGVFYQLSAPFCIAPQP